MLQFLQMFILLQGGAYDNTGVCNALIDPLEAFYPNFEQKPKRRLMTVCQSVSVLPFLKLMRSPCWLLCSVPKCLLGGI